MTRKPDKSYACAVCGQGGYWVAYDSTTGSYRCANHIGSTPELLRLAERGACLACGAECSWPEHDAPQPTEPSSEEASHA